MFGTLTEIKSIRDWDTVITWNTPCPGQPSTCHIIQTPHWADKNTHIWSYTHTIEVQLKLAMKQPWFQFRVITLSPVWDVYVSESSVLTHYVNFIKYPTCFNTFGIVSMTKSAQGHCSLGHIYHIEVMSFSGIWRLIMTWKIVYITIFLFKCIDKCNDWATKSNIPIHLTLSLNVTITTIFIIYCFIYWFIYID